MAEQNHRMKKAQAFGRAHTVAKIRDIKGGDKWTALYQKLNTRKVISRGQEEWEGEGLPNVPALNIS
jgi:hypothetical protein